ncbi:right-handed parallel beta-helix repeat-containing protein [Reichenbachiella carrageenanivorans]|uniref:Right-handed parallel beta-helix repeat-containing protein n=1 Tax=Reichenbachiella carrageenanivorans TaxID=2979869 RepID=A0ABY6D4M8_9BACT|nr:right-handed parallel beta-helix repeat-containing protein [Reichenbachiella carrageenanivorans]UXX80073.1 right-handed parallel beta-helix repeat-containing protein [Reichenbachiella carrageenanivorans]
MKNSILLILVTISLFRCANVPIPRNLDMKDLGILEAKDVTPLVIKALEQCKEQGISKLTFPKGTYHFYPTFAPDFYCAITNNDNGLKRTAFPLIGFDGLEIDGGGSEFIFHGKMLPFIIEESSNLKVTNFSLDWEVPFFLQGEVIDNDPVNKTFDIHVVTPHKLDNGHLYMSLEREDSPYERKYGYKFTQQEKYDQMVGQNIIWDASTKAPLYAHNRYSSFDTHHFPASQINENLVRLETSYKETPPVGSVFVSKGEYLFNRQNPAFRVFKTKNLLLNNVTVHHAGGMGLIAERSENITLDGFNVMLKEGSGRYITSTADATHFCNCKGLVTIKNCTFENMLDDATNIHGTYVRVNKILADDQVAVETYHPHQNDYLFGEVGDSIQVIDQKTLLPTREPLVIKNIKRVNEKISILTFSESVKGSVSVYDGIENITWHAAALIENNIIRNNRARGLLISTPRKVEVRNNYISSQMAAFRITGDLGLWNESGPCDSLIIENNKIENCVYSGIPQSVFQIDPQYESKKYIEGAYSRNIFIRNNEIRTFDASILKAMSVDGLYFQGNDIIQTDTYLPLFPNKPNLEIINCKNVKTDGNTYRLLSGDKGELSVKTDSAIQ